ncbi:hypothetical protein [Actinomadura parmotrematis]|uniref:Small CPxCG-related zinc finger protein n=1 Tax=Actinomadura parmotrematis TaxID=2864039 RepID=A0ABS7FZ59_9ACTN|nr:hypothetical protein [Actinomadura parmotrematis]MBW8485718.1 hypothetical protein [Actinomadura parmotrematis]
MADPVNGAPCTRCRGRQEIVFTHRDGQRSVVSCWACETPGAPYDAGRGQSLTVADHPAVRDSGLCRFCLGAGVVVTSLLGYAESACPACGTD